MTIRPFSLPQALRFGTLGLPVKISIALFLLMGCGSNLFESLDPPDPEEDAALSLEQNRPNDAIKTLESALKKSPDNPQYLSILASAYAQRAGVEPISMARNFVYGNSPSSGTDPNRGDVGQSSLVSLFLFVPKATAASVADINYAVSLLNTDLGRERWTPADSFKFAIFQTASLVMALKVLDKNEDGTLSLAEIASLSSGTSILSQLNSSHTVLSQSTDDAVAVKTAEILARYQSDITSSGGDSDDEKLKNYLSKASTSTSLSELP